jgi:hypothetical protein
MVHNEEFHTIIDFLTLSIVLFSFKLCNVCLNSWRRFKFVFGFYILSCVGSGVRT